MALIDKQKMISRECIIDLNAKRNQMLYATKIAKPPEISLKAAVK